MGRKRAVAVGLGLAAGVSTFLLWAVVTTSPILLLAGCCVTAPKVAPHGATPALPSASDTRSIDVLTTNAAAPEPPRHRDIHEICALNAELGISLCEQLAAGAPNDCVQMCVAQYRLSHQPEHPVDAAIPATPSAPPSASPSSDPYFFALADCIRRARDGELPPVCHFASPLDQMDFGQKHCDARCADLADVSPAANPVR